MLFPIVDRELDGVCITGELVALRLQPDASGNILVMVLGLPAATGFDRACRLSSCDEMPSFAPADITVHDTRLECFAPDPYAPSVRTGFTLELEPGMAPLLREWLTKLAKVSAASKAISEKFNRQLPPPIYHMFSAITSVVRRIVVDRWSVKDAVAYEREHGTWREHGEFMAVFDVDDIVNDLRALADAGA